MENNSQFHKGRILAIDPGSKNLGIAISDPTGTLATQVDVLSFDSYDKVAASIVGLIRKHEVNLLVIGQSLDENGTPTYSGRRAIRLSRAIKSQLDIPVVFWDETLSTQDARATRIKMGVKRHDRSGHIDSLAAVLILQSFLDNK